MSASKRGVRITLLQLGLPALLGATLPIILLTEKGKTLQIETEIWASGSSIEHGKKPLQQYLSPDFSPAGAWTKRGMVGVGLEVAGPENGPFSVTFETGGCTASWVLNRTGKLEDGALVLGKPVREYGGQAYDRFYLVRVAGFPGLLAETRVERFNEAASREEVDLSEVSHSMLMLSDQREDLWKKIREPLFDATE